MNPTQLADYVADNLPQTQPEIDEFTARLNSRIDELPESVKSYIYDSIQFVLVNAKCKLHPA